MTSSVRRFDCEAISDTYVPITYVSSENGDLIWYDDHKDVVNRLEARIKELEDENERLESAYRSIT